MKRTSKNYLLLLKPGLIIAFKNRRKEIKKKQIKILLMKWLKILLQIRRKMPPGYDRLCRSLSPAHWEERLAQAQEKLVQTEQQAMVADLAGATAHELNQPLTSVMGYAELLRRRMDRDDENRPAVDTIIREAERLADIVRKIDQIIAFETRAYSCPGVQVLDLEKSE